MNSISSDLQNFIFHHLDSIGFLEALLILHSNPTRAWTVETLAQELRHNSTTTAEYLKKMLALRIAASPDAGTFVYNPQSGFETTLAELAEAHRVQRHKIFSLIYSPLKKARDFSKAFVLPNAVEKKKEDDGG